MAAPPFQELTMPRAKSQDLRDRVLALRDQGRPTKAVAELLGVARSWVRRVVQVRRETGRTTPLPRGGYRYSKVDRERLAELVEPHPDATVAELHALLDCDCGVSAVDQALRDLGWTVKKKTIHAAEQDRPDVAQPRERWKASQPSRDAGRFIFIDETWTKTHMTRLYGRSPRGRRLVEKVPLGHWKTTTLIAALGVEGIVCSKVVDGAVRFRGR